MILVVIAESEVVLTGIIDVLFCLTVAFVKLILVNASVLQRKGAAKNPFHIRHFCISHILYINLSNKTLFPAKSPYVYPIIMRRYMGEYSPYPKCVFRLMAHWNSSPFFIKSSNVNFSGRDFCILSIS